MADNTATPPIESWLPEDVWILIASLLDDDELARFREVCTWFNKIGSDAMVLQPLYNDLRAMDKTLPADLQTAAAQVGKSPLVFFKEAFEKIQTRQQQEIAYLTKHHSTVMAKSEYAQPLQQNTSVLLKSLKAKHALLDAINSEIVTAKIDINSTTLDLNSARITRLPVTLFKAEGYVNFWKNLTTLECQGNQLTALNLQGLAALQRLDCSNNQLPALNLQGLVALQRLYCGNNPLTDLNLTGVPAAIKNQHAELEKILLLKQLNSPSSKEARQKVIARLGANFTRENCDNYCPEYAKTLFDSDASFVVLSSLAKMSIYIPSSSANNKDQAEEKTSATQREEPGDELGYKPRKARKKS